MKNESLKKASLLLFSTYYLTLQASFILQLDD